MVVTDNAANSPQSVTATGTGVAGTVTFSPTNLSFANQPVNTSSASKTIVLTNNTGANLTISKIAASSNYSQTNTCGTGITAGATCNIVVIFKPTSTGIIHGTITITDTAATNPQSVPLSGTGIAATIGFAPTALTFADQTVGTTSSAGIVTLSNTGTAALTIHSIAISGTNSGDFAQTHTCIGNTCGRQGLHYQCDVQTHGDRHSHRQYYGK